MKTITPAELFQRMEDGNPLFILDVRNADAYAEWKIEGRTIQSKNIPYFDFMEDDAPDLDQLPQDQEIIVVCAKTGSSQYVANILQEKGFQAVPMEGGMHDWSLFFTAKEVLTEDNLTLIQINRLAKGCLSYMIISEGQAIVVEPLRNVDFYLALAEQYQSKICHILDSHLHADHISTGAELAQATGATYYLNSSEGAKVNFEPLETYETLSMGKVKVEVLVLDTPGHTPGSLSFLINETYLLSGDTIFVGGIGRPDLGGKVREWAEDLYETLFTRIASLPDDVLVLPSHYESYKEINAQGVVSATLGEIRQQTELLQVTDRSLFVDKISESASSIKPPNYEEIIAINRGDMVADFDYATELEIGPNRCAAHHTNL